MPRPESTRSAAAVGRPRPLSPLAAASGCGDAAHAVWSASVDSAPRMRPQRWHAAARLVVVREAALADPSLVHGDTLSEGCHARQCDVRSLQRTPPVLVSRPPSDAGRPGRERSRPPPNGPRPRARRRRPCPVRPTPPMHATAASPTSRALTISPTIASISSTLARRVAVGDRAADDRDAGVAATLDDRRVAPAGELVVLDEQDQKPHSARPKGLRGPRELAAIDTPRIALGRPMLSRHEGQPQPAGTPVGEFGSVEPVDPQRRVEVAARRPVDGSVHAQFRVPSPPPRQKWPVGSSGWPQKGHGGRPPASSTSARATKRRAWDTSIRTRSRSGPSSASSGSSR